MLAELLGAKEPFFSLSLRQLEKMSGSTSHDIRLSADIRRATAKKLHLLGLDGGDTTGEELYNALCERATLDDARLKNALIEKFSSGQAGDDSLPAIVRALEQLPVPKNCFALKPAVLKTLLKKTPPKRVMKQLHYRSLDSMLKHEPAPNLLAAGLLVESANWQKDFLAGYKGLKASDFETRRLTMLHPSSRRWHDFAMGAVKESKNNVVALKEAGAVVLLPFPGEQPPLATTASLVLALHALNEVRAAGTYLKLCQVKANFGSVVQATVSDEPYLSAQLLDQPVSWQLVQRYCTRSAQALKADVFEPHVQPEDLSWHSVEKALAHIEPSLAFWQHTDALGFLHGHDAVSLNLADVALSVCNHLPYAQRLTHFLRRSLLHELLMRYMQHEAVEQTVTSELAAELEPALT